VRLRVYIFVETNIGDSIFQFLLVRLRVRNLCFIVECKYIFVETNIGDSIFQFLLVRLRVRNLCFIVECNRISIPSGAIKS